MIDKLLEYQETEKELVAIKQQLSKSESRKRATNAKMYIEKSKDVNAGLDSRAKELIQLFVNLQEEYKVLSEELNDFSLAKGQVDTKESAIFLESKATELISKIATVEQKFNDIQAEMAQISKEFGVAKDKLSLARKQLKEDGAKYNEELEAVTPQMNEIKAKLNELKKGIDATLMAKYEAKRKDGLFPVVFEAKSANCGRCCVEFSLVQQNELNAKKILECEHCHAINYKK